MTKAELIRAVSAETGLTLKDSAAVLDAVLSAVAGELAHGGRVQITGFGTFQTKERAAHVGRNMATGEPVSVPAFRAVQFRPGKLLKAQVNGTEPEAEPEPDEAE